MVRSTRLRSVLVLVLCAGLLAAVAAPPPLRAATPLGGETPEALLARLQAAVEAGDFGEIAACMAPEERAEMAVGLLLAGGMMAAFAQMGGEMAGDMAEAFGEEGDAEENGEAVEQRKQEAAAEAAKIAERFEKILADHGLSGAMEGDLMAGDGDEGKGSAQELLKDVDQVALVRDIMTFLSEMGEGDISDKAQDKLGGEITLGKIEGDRATARRGDETVELVRIEGRWYLKPTQ